MAKNSFRIIGIKAVRPKPDEFPIDFPMQKHYEKVQEIQKVLYDTNRWFYFYKGITIYEGNSAVEMDKVAKGDFSLYDTSDLKVSICAIVGKNGAGKSSMVELLVRTINNLAAALLGEGNNFSSSEHLHFIDYVFADLCFQKGDIVYILQSHGRHVKLTLYKASTAHYYVYKPFKTYDILDQNRHADTYILLKQHSDGRRILKSLFFTLVCNYSLYGFNYRDYLSEATPAKRLENLKIKVNDDAPTEDSMWLKGIFHKNDGYQTPIVLHPMRDDGILNVVKENSLAKERLAALLFYKDNTGHYPLRTINGDLHVVALRIRPTKIRQYEEDSMLDVLGIGKNQNIYKNIDHVRNFILGFWDEKYDITKKGRNKTQKKDAYDYIVYKTLKIIKNYKKYHPVFVYLSRKYIDYRILKDLMTPLGQDYTHITKKLLRTINYLATDMYSSPDNYYNLQLLENDMDSLGIRSNIKGKNVVVKQNLLPPPIFDIDLVLTKGEDAHTIIPFSSISSGERQIAYTISNMMYHLVNVDSEWNDNYRKDKDHVDIVKYRYTNVIFDEVELYYHPEMQRQFTSIMMKTLRSVHFANIRGINIMLVTHSPFVLSDIPDSNVLFVGEEGQEATKTLGGNIMEMLSSSFFMSSSIGEAIKEEITAIVDMYNKAVRNGEDVRFLYHDRRKRFKYICDTVGDEFLKDMVTNMVDDIEQRVKSN